MLRDTRFACLLVAAFLLTALPPLSAQATTRVSVDSAGVEGNNGSWVPSISGDGRFVAFESYASNLVPGDTNLTVDVFVHDRQTGQTTRVSVDSAGVEGNGWSWPSSISGDGRFVAFESGASNLVPGDTNLTGDVFVHDRQTGQTTRVSVDSAGVEGNSVSQTHSISGDGRFVAFESAAYNLVPGDTNGRYDVFVHDRLGISLTRTGTCPGSMSFTASGVTPGGTVAFVWGNPGSFTIPPGKPCANMVLDLAPLLVPAPGYELGSGTPSGVATWQVQVPANACGLLLQAVDVTTCRTTNIMEL